MDGDVQPRTDSVKPAVYGDSSLVVERLFVEQKVVGSTPTCHIMKNGVVLDPKAAEVVRRVLSESPKETSPEAREGMRKYKECLMSQSSLRIAQFFHNTYESLAPEHGYETRDDTKEFDPSTPNGKLMVAVVEDTGLKVLMTLAEATEEYLGHTNHCDRFWHGQTCAQCRERREQLELLLEGFEKTPLGRLPYESVG